VRAVNHVCLAAGQLFPVACKGHAVRTAWLFYFCTGKLIGLGDSINKNMAKKLYLQHVFLKMKMLFM